MSEKGRMVTLSTLVPSADLPAARSTLAWLEQEADRRGWPGPAPRARHRACLVVVTTAPTLPPERLALPARYAWWSLLLDDRLDDPAADPAALARLRDAVVAATHGHPDPDEPVATGLADLLIDLSRHDPTGRTPARLGAALREAVRHDVDHVLLGRSVAAGRRPPPTAEEYLAAAAHTVNYRGFAYTLLAVAHPPSARPAPDRLEPALWHAAHAVRLANDLRGYDRDRAAAALNVRDLRTADGRPVTDRWVRRGIDRHRRAHDAALTATGPAASVRTLIRSLRASLGFYRLTDLR